MKILFVDDEVWKISDIPEYFRKNGYEVYEANNGQEGIDKAREINPDFIITDGMMPIKDGYDLARNLKTEEPIYRGKIILSSAGMAFMRISYPDCEKYFDGNVDKPVKYEELLRAIESMTTPAQGR